MGNLWQDLRYGIRVLAKNPGFTFVAMLTIALGIGANTAIFSVVNALLLRPLPVKDPGQLVVLTEQQDTSALVTYFSFPDVVDFRQQAAGFSDIMGYYLGLSGISADGKAERAMVSYTTSNYFTMLGIDAAVGRTIQPSDGDTAGANPVVVLGYSFWQRRFGGDRGAIGKSILVDGHPVTIIGVMPQKFLGVFTALDMEAYLPLGLRPNFGNDKGDPWANRGKRILRVLGRLKPGVTVAQAQASLDVVAARIAAQYPDTNKGMKARAYPERQARPEPDPNNSMATVATLFLVLAGMVLLVACVNVANILLVRATARRREMAIRAALGAGRARLIRQLLTESVLLAVGGGLGGLLLGLWGSSLLASLRTSVDLPIFIDFGMDWRVFVYSFGAALLTGVVVGIVPALRGSRADVSAVLHSRAGDVTPGAEPRGVWRVFSYSFLSSKLKGAVVAIVPALRSSRSGGGAGLYEGGRAVTAGRERQSVRNLLVVAQLAGSMVLLIVAGLFVRSLQQAQRLSLGFEPDHVMNMSMDPNEVGYDEARGRTFYRELESRVRALPGVESASLAFSVPLGFAHQTEKISIEGKPAPESEHVPEYVYNTVGPAYFSTMRIPILRGRAFAESDSETAPQVAIVNETFAKKFWPNEDPIGKRFSMLKKPGKPMEVIGVSKDGRYVDPVDPPDPYFFVPFAQHYISYQTLQVRTALPPEALIPEVERQVLALDPNLPVFDVRTMRRALNGINGYFTFQLGAGLAAIMGLLGLVLAVVGVYGVVSYSAGQRTQEIGIRLAMGAQRSDILRMVLNQGSVLVALGLAVGFVAAAMLTRAISSLLVGVSPIDPLTFAGVSVLLSFVALTACYIPALRATRVDPLTALRYE